MNAALLFLVSPALGGAAPLPAPPGPSEPVPGQCAEVVGVELGAAVPGRILDPDLLAPCSFLAVPLSWYADLLDAETDREMVRRLYSVEAANWAIREDWYVAELARVTEPLPWMDRPAVHGAVGLITGVATVMGSAYALKQLTEAE